MITVTPIPVFSDNYAYVLRAVNGQVALVDPGQAAPVITYLEAHNLKPDMILVTHHHWDHFDGVPDILEWNSCPLIGADRNKSDENSPAKTRLKTPFDQILGASSDFSFGGEKMTIIEAPGHTPEHLCFYFENSQILMAGDVMFSLGCGRLLDGTAEEMWNSLQKLRQLPDDTQLYCGHEYTLSNAEFCVSIEPENAALIARAEEVKKLRAQNKPTLPVSLGTEKQTNLFLRAESAERFAELRSLKDNF